MSSGYYDIDAILTDAQVGCDTSMNLIYHTIPHILTVPSN